MAKRDEKSAMRNNDDTRPDKFASLKDGLDDARAVETYYDDWARTYDETLKHWNYQAPDDAAALLAPHLKQDARILDVGCGTGLMADALKQKGRYRIDGIDVSAESLDLAKQRGGYERLIHHDLTRLPLPVGDDAYDAAASVGVLTYIDDIEALLSDLCRLVRAGGVIAFTHRTDLWEKQDFSKTIEALDGKGLWMTLDVGAPRPYLPGNDDYAQSIEVIHTLCRVN